MEAVQRSFPFEHFVLCFECSLAQLQALRYNGGKCRSSKGETREMTFCSEKKDSVSQTLVLDFQITINASRSNEFLFFLSQVIKTLQSKL